MSLYFIFWILVFSFILFFTVNIFLLSDIISENSYQYDLEKHGVSIIPSVFTDSETDKLKKLCDNGQFKETKEFLIQHTGLQNKCFKKTGENYIFQDYIWIIQKSVVHTCHRDNNGDFFNKGQKYPSYTVLVYLEPMEKSLGVIPKSHLEKGSFNFNITDPIIHLTCNPGDVIIFNANLIHVGAMNKKDHHLRCQMKVSHREDIPVLGYYQNFNKVLNQENTLPGFIRHIQKRGSCALPMISDLTQSENIRTARGSDNGINIGIFQKTFSYLFYGNKDFYDLPNAF